jgi:hypothetical protein
VNHPDYGGHGWYEKNEVEDEYESLEDRLKKLNAYDSYYKTY